MSSFLNVIEKSDWFNKGGPEDDVVLFSRLRLARNLQDYPFPHILSKKEEKQVENRIIKAFKNLPQKNKFTILYLDDIRSVEKNVLLERNIITREYYKLKDRVILISDDGEISCMINEEDHIRLSCIKGGLAVKNAFKKINHIDSLLENNITYASSIECGYLNTALKNTGTGLSVSVLVHLPALTLSSLFEEVLNLIIKKGFIVKDYKLENNISLRGVYKISNKISIGYSEYEIIEYMLELLVSIIDLERETRKALYLDDSQGIKDQIFTAFDDLKNCSIISMNEAVEKLSLIRLGICIGVLKNISINSVTKLFFILQNYHIQTILEGMKIYISGCDSLRAEIIKDILL